MTSYGLPSDPGKYCIVVNYVVFEANKNKKKSLNQITFYYPFRVNLGSYSMC